MAKIKRVRFRKNKMYRITSIYSESEFDSLVKFIGTDKYGKLKFFGIYMFQQSHVLGIPMSIVGHKIEYDKEFLSNSRFFKVRNAKPAEIALYGKV